MRQTKVHCLRLEQPYHVEFEDQIRADAIIGPLGPEQRWIVARRLLRLAWEVTRGRVAMISVPINVALGTNIAVRTSPVTMRDALVSDE